MSRLNATHICGLIAMVKVGAGYPDLRFDERFGDSLQESTDRDVVARSVGERQRERADDFCGGRRSLASQEAR